MNAGSSLARTMGLVGVLALVAGIAICVTTNLYPTIIVRHVSVQETSTDWYETGPFVAQAGDWFDIDVQTSGGNGKLVVRRQDGYDLLGEIQSSSLVYEVPVDKSDTYKVQIWTRAWPFASNYINLTGTIDLKRVTLSTFGYLAIGLLGGGACLIIGSMSLHYYQRTQARKLEVEFRNCPSCGRKVHVTHKVCPYCGHDILQFAKCRNCGTSYNRASAKCPNCGAPNR